jgi:hypothetical protein
VTEMAINLTAAEKALRDRFVKEYMKDYDALGAATRVGYSSSYAGQFAGQFMQEPYTRLAISKAEEALGGKTEKERHRKRVVTMLYREANARGAGTSHGARVSALGRIGTMLGLDEPAKIEVTEKTSAVTFYIPQNGRD